MAFTWETNHSSPGGSEDRMTHRLFSGSASENGMEKQPEANGSICDYKTA